LADTGALRSFGITVLVAVGGTGGWVVGFTCGVGLKLASGGGVGAGVLGSVGTAVCAQTNPASRNKTGQNTRFFMLT
jgi:hypothetical protein